MPLARGSQSPHHPRRARPSKQHRRGPDEASCCRACGGCHLHPAGWGVRRRLADAADPHHRAVDARRCRRHVRTPALRLFQRNVSRALLRRESCRRRRADRNGGHRAGGAGRLHAHHVEHRLSCDRAGGEPEPRLRSDEGLHPHRLCRRTTQRLRGEPRIRGALAQGAGGARAARPGDRLRLARGRHARASAGGNLRTEGRHQAAADHDQGRLAGDDGPHQRQRECRDHDLDIGADADPRRQGHSDRGLVERAACGISGPADIQGSRLCGSHGSVVVRAVRTGGLAERHHRAAQCGGRPDAGAARRCADASTAMRSRPGR